VEEELLVAGRKLPDNTGSKKGYTALGKISKSLTIDRKVMIINIRDYLRVISS